MRSVFQGLKRYFFTGLAVFLPLLITIYILGILFKFADKPLGQFANLILEKLIGREIPGIGIVITLILILLIGFITANVLGKKLFQWLERGFLRIPLIRQVYHPVRQMVDFLFSKEKVSFKKVAMVEYPRKGIYSIGFITNEGIDEINRKGGRLLTGILIPTTPSPISGFLIFVPKEEVIILDMSVEEGLKLIVSGGLLGPGSNHPTLVKEDK